MTSLLDPPDEPTQALLDTIGKGRAMGTDWPIWQWVSRQMSVEHDLNAQLVFDSMPTWRTKTSDYRSVRSPGVGRQFQPTSPIHLTMHGLVHCAPAAASSASINTLLALVTAARTEQMTTIAASPTSLVSIVVSRDDLVTRVARVWPIQASEIFHLLQGEPDLNAVIGGVDDSIPWKWDVTDLELNRYADIPTGTAYLAALDGHLQETMTAAPIPQLPPMALPDALDHINLTWRLVFGQPLIVVHRAAIPARLTFGVDSFEELQSRCSALADLMDAFNIPRQQGEVGGTLQLLERRVATRLGTELPDPLARALTNLRSIVAIRDDLQHSRSSSGRPGQARIELGLSRYGSDWSQQWELLRVTAVDAFRVIREHLDPLIL